MARIPTAKILFLGVLVGFGFGEGEADTISQPGDTTFSATLGSAVEIDTVSLDTMILMDCSGDRCACSGGNCSEPGSSWYRSSTSSVGSGQWAAHLTKDDYTGWTASDVCVPGSDIFDWDDGSFTHPDLWRVNASEYRTGPTVASGDLAATWPSGAELTPPFDRPLALRFLTGAAYANEGTVAADYTVTWVYASGGSLVQTVTIQAVASSIRESAGADWQVAAGQSFFSVCSYTMSYLDEVVADNPDPTRDVTSVTIDYTTGDLLGPVAISFDADEAAYAEAFVYQASYITADTTLPANDFGHNAIWYGVGWSHTLDDGGSLGYSNPVPYGDFVLEVFCGDGSVPVWQSAGIFSNTTGDAEDTVHLWDAGAGAACAGAHARYLIVVEAYLGRSPSIDTLTLHYDMDVDEDGYGVSGWSQSMNMMGIPDCNDGDNAIYPGAVDDGYPEQTSVCGDGVDSDCDGIGGPDGDEDGDGCSWTAEDAVGISDCNLDSDNDDLGDFAEMGGDCLYDAGETDPNDADTDDDLADDGDEVNAMGTDPLDADSDDDALSDHEEDRDHDGVWDVGLRETRALDADTDDDGLEDGEEDLDGDGVLDSNELDPLDADTDNDLLNDGLELARTTPVLAGVSDVWNVAFLGTASGWTADSDSGTATDPRDPDSDDDGLDDGVEDVDGDGAVDVAETDPMDADFDDDGLADGTEDVNLSGDVNTGETDPRDGDSDNDLLNDGLELGVVLGVPGGTSDWSSLTFAGTNTGIWDFDTDPATDTDPLLADTDNDWLEDGEEDADGDGAKSELETDPRLWDTDGDTYSDGLEVECGSDPLDRESLPVCTIFEDDFETGNLSRWSTSAL